MSYSDADIEEFEDYYAEISEGCGCTELWEYMSERRHEGRITPE